jgi:hypothetical protein
VRLEHFEKHNLPILRTDARIVIVAKRLHSENTKSPISVSLEPLSNAMDDRSSQNLKHFDLMISTDVGMRQTLSKPHHLNADSHNSVTAEGNSNPIVSTTDSQNMKFGEIECTEAGIQSRASFRKFATRDLDCLRMMKPPSSSKCRFAGSMENSSTQSSGKGDPSIFSSDAGRQMDFKPVHSPKAHREITRSCEPDSKFTHAISRHSPKQFRSREITDAGITTEASERHPTNPFALIRD